MAKKKDRAFFVCPRWSEVAGIPRTIASNTTTRIGINEKTLIAIKNGRPVARSTPGPFSSNYLVANGHRTSKLGLCA